MAFTLDQKKQLTLLVDAPQEFLQKCKDEKIYLKGFGNEFFKDGAGIFHVLSECIVKSTNYDYVELMNYLLKEKNELDLFQKTGRKNSAFTILTDGAKNDSSLCQNITDFLMGFKKINNKDSYHIRSFIEILAKHGLVQQIEQLVNKFEELNSNSEVVFFLLKSSIENDDTNIFKLLISNEKTFEILQSKITNYKFNYEKKYNSPQYINPYGYAVNYGSKNVLTLLVNHFGNKFNFNGQLIDNNYKSVLTPHPLSIALNNKNLDLFNQYYGLIDLNAKGEWLSKKDDLSILSDSFLGKIIFKDFYEIFKSGDVQKQHKFNLFNHILRTTLNEESSKKYQKMEELLAPIWDLLPPIDGAYVFMGSKFFFNNFHSKGDMSEKEIDAFVNIFKKLKRIGHFEIVDGLFSNSFFNEPNLVKKLIENGLDLHVLPTTRFIGEGVKDTEYNIYEFYLNNFKRFKNESQYNKSAFPLNVDIAKETLKIIYDQDKSLVFNLTSKNQSILQLAIDYHAKEIFELLTVEDFKKFKITNEKELLIQIPKTYGISDSAKEAFNVCLKKMMDADFNLKELYQTTYSNDPIYYSFFDKVSDFSLMEEFINKYKIDLNVDAQNENFWGNIKTENSLDFLKGKISCVLPQKTAKQIMRRFSFSDGSNNFLENITFVLPDIYLTKLEGNENILHNAIKNGAFKLTKIIVDKYPILASQENKQNKLPISYMIPGFAKLLEKSSMSYSDKGKLEQTAELLNFLLIASVDATNKKAIQFLDDQLNKYKIIEKFFPDIFAQYRYEKMERALPKHNAPKEKKLKI